MKLIFSFSILCSLEVSLSPAHTQVGGRLSYTSLEQGEDGRYYVEFFSKKYAFLLSSLSSVYDKPRQGIEKQRHYSANKDLYSQGYGLPGGHGGLWELDCKEGRAPKNWFLWTVLLEKTSESPLDSKELSQLYNLK